MRKKNKSELTLVQKDALKRAVETMENSYNPYSEFAVGACIYSEDGNLVEGTNFENASYSLTICAERSAIVRANAKGFRNFRGIVVVSGGDQLTGPCGACRQVILELAEINDSTFEVIMASTDLENVTIATINELLPLSFGPSNLDIDLSQYR